MQSLGSFPIQLQSRFVFRAPSAAHWHRPAALTHDVPLPASVTNQGSVKVTPHFVLVATIA